MADAAAAAGATATAQKAPLIGVVDLLYAVLDDLAARGPGFPDPLPQAGDAARPDPQARGATASLGDLVDRLGERGFGLLFFLLALPCVPPFVYVLPQIAALPMLVLAGQMAMGRAAPWLPENIRRRTFSIGDLRRVIERMEKYVRFVERFARPRLRPVTGRGAAPVLGALLLIPAISILVPMVGTNSVPSAGIAVAALGLIARDGVLVILGLLVGVLWPVFLVALFLALGTEGLKIAKDWVLSRL